MQNVVSTEPKLIFSKKLHSQYPGLIDLEDKLNKRSKYTFIRSTFSEIKECLKTEKLGINLSRVAFINIRNVVVVEYLYKNKLIEHSWIILYVYNYKDLSLIEKDEISRKDWLSEIQQGWGDRFGTFEYNPNMDCDVALTLIATSMISVPGRNINDTITIFSMVKYLRGFLIMRSMFKKNELVPLEDACDLLNFHQERISSMFFHDDFIFKFSVLEDARNTIKFNATRKFHIY